MTLGIIGTAGRGADSDRLTKDSLVLMFGVAQSFVTLLGVDRVVSGGAAWADSVAVSLYTRGIVPNLTLHLPAAFLDNAFDDTDAGRTANRYHVRAASITGIDGLIEIRNAIDKDARVTIETGPGFTPFFARNERVAQDADVMLAFTFGVAGHPALKDGGTADTMRKFLARRDPHVETAAKQGVDTYGLFRAAAYHFNLTDNRLYAL